MPDAADLTGIETVADVEKLVARLGRRRRARSRSAIACARRRRRRTSGREEGKLDDDIDVPRPLVALGRRALRGGMRALYERVFETDVYGARNVPPFGGFIVAANHASHLDMGLVKYALGEQGEALVALGAKDYFFEDPVRRMYFENFTNLVPMDRHGSLRESLRLAGEVIREGYILLIFPEGTRSDDGRHGRLQAVARLPRDDEQVRHAADVPAPARTTRCRRAASCRSAASGSRRTSGRTCRTRMSRSSPARQVAERAVPRDHVSRRVA